MKPNFTDTHKYPRGYVRSEATDIAKTWDAVRRKLAQERKQSADNVRLLKPIAGART